MSRRLIYARVASFGNNNEFTEAEIVLFGRGINRFFRDGNHRAAAAVWVAEWDKYLADRWGEMEQEMRMFVIMLDTFLVKHGATRQLIDNALSDLRKASEQNAQRVFSGFGNTQQTRP